MRRVRIALAVCVIAVAALFAASARGALQPYTFFGPATMTSGFQVAGLYDCPQRSQMWISASLLKSIARLGKVVFINGNGSWIAAKEDSTTFTNLYRADLESTMKKPLVKNTWTGAYQGTGTAYDRTETGCV